MNLLSAFKYKDLYLFKLLLIWAILLLPRLASAQTDQQFWFVAPYVFDAGRNFDKPIELRVATASAAATVTISMPADPSFTPIVRNVGANATVTIDLTQWINQIENTPANTTLNRGLLISSTADITAYYEVVSSYCNCDPEIFSLKGKNALGTEFFISSQYNHSESTAYTGATNSFDIVATQNNTHVTITPSNNIVGHIANVPFTITLNAGQTYSAVAVSSAAAGHLQGSYVSTDNPVAVTLKDDLVQVSSCADLAGDQTVPTSVLGTDYIVDKGYLQPYDEVYITAIENGTNIFVDGNATPLTTLAKGASTTINLSNPSTYVRADKKIYVYHFTGNGCEVGSAIIPKLNCTGSQTVSIVRSNNGGSSDIFAVTITTKSGNQGNFTVNGDNTLVKGSNFSTVLGTNGAYVTATIDLSSFISENSIAKFSNSSGVFSLGMINGGSNDGVRYGFFSDFKSSNVTNSYVETCPSSPVQLNAYGGVSYHWTPSTGLSDPNIANPIASPTASTNYTVSITTADGCVDMAYVQVKVLNTVTPSATIAASANNICSGTAVTFTATPTNAGATPSYQWQVNGINTGTSSPTFTSSTLANNDKVTCSITGSAQCTTSGSAASNVITMAVTPSVTPAVSIAVSQNNICGGTSVTFTATPVNGGSRPSYQWQINGINIASGYNNTISSATMANGDKITCLMTSNAACVSSGNVTSNVITMVVNSGVTPSVDITAAQNNICKGATVTFTATPTNGGTSPVYQWQVNGTNTGTNSANFSSNTLANNDKVICTLTSSVACTTAAPVTSNIITMNVVDYITPSVTITASATNICPGTTVTFNAQPVNGGLNPTYQWLLNGINAGTNSATFSINTLQNGDAVSCMVYSNAPCTTQPSAVSNQVSITVNPAVNPSVNITASANNVCYGTPIMFTAAPTNGGNAPVYQWQVNGLNVGSNSNIFTSSNLNNNDVLSCSLISNAICAAPSVTNSNSVTMQIIPLPIADAGNDKVIEKGNTTKLNGTTPSSAVTVSWSPVDGLDNPNILTPIASPEKTIVYTLTVKTTGGCIATDDVKVTVHLTVLAPNAFTPNGDGINDKWNIKNLSDYPDCTVYIFNRWGQEVFRSRGYHIAWDGTLNGKLLPFTTYYYIINLNNNTQPLSGNVTIVR